jgi:hypothetical protein
MHLGAFFQAQQQLQRHFPFKSNRKQKQKKTFFPPFFLRAAKSAKILYLPFFTPHPPLTSSG